MEFAEHTAGIYSVIWSPASPDRFASVAGDGQLKIWDVNGFPYFLLPAFIQPRTNRKKQNVTQCKLSSHIQRKYCPAIGINTKNTLWSLALSTNPSKYGTSGIPGGKSLRCMAMLWLFEELNAPLTMKVFWLLVLSS